MNYSDLKKTDAANGPGVRVSLWVSGCSLRCPGCFNAAAWDCNAGQPFTQETMAEILEALDKPYIQGLTLLGGDPLEPSNQSSTLDIIETVRERFGETKDIWMWTGRTLKYLKESNQTTALECISKVDVLVDGPFIESLKDPRLKYAGSSNQNVINVKTGELIENY